MDTGQIAQIDVMVSQVGMQRRFALPDEEKTGLCLGEMPRARWMLWRVMPW